MRGNSTHRFVLTSISHTENNVSVTSATSETIPVQPMHRGLERAAERHGDRVAVRMDDGSWTFAELDGLADAFAHHLASQGVAPGDRVAVMTTNRVEFVAAVHGISKRGAAAVLLSPAWKAVEVDHALGLTGPRHAVADGPAVALLGARLGTGAVTDLDDPATDAAIAELHPTGPSPADTGAGGGLDDTVSVTDDVILVFSSGTTGMPKAVRHTHGSLGHATAHWVAALGLGPDDRFQVATPPSHILGLLNLLAAAEAGAGVRLHRRFDLDEVLARIGTDRITIEMAVAPIALAMANHPDLERYDLSSLRYVMWGATPVTASVADTVTARTGVRWLAAYGASELPVIACNPVDDPAAWRLDSAGLPPPGVELRVIDLDTGGGLPPGGTGEIQARSPSVMAGYLPDAADADHLTDRSKKMIKVNGFQVAPAEVEAVLHGHPAVVDCAVFGVADERAGEVPVAAVQLDPERPVADGELAALVADSLATYKHLRHVVQVETIPRLPSGKVLRRTLRHEWAPLISARKDG